MKRLAQKKIHLSLALGIIAVVGISAGLGIAVKAAGTFGSFGGRITIVNNCVIENPLTPNVCNTCLLCTKDLQSACALHNEVHFSSAGGGYKQPYLCVPKGQRFLGGGSAARPGALLLGNALSSFIFRQIGVSR